VAVTIDVRAEAEAVGTLADLARVLSGLREREVRRGAQLSYRQIAARAGISLGAVASYLNGGRLPASERFALLVEVLGADDTERAALGAAWRRIASPGPGAVPRALPAQPYGFTGRGQHLARLEGLLDAAPLPIRCAAITGMPGVGKTALALHWAHEVAPRFPGGQLYVDLHAYAPGKPLSVMDALGVLLAALGSDLEGLPDLASRSRRYQTLLRGRPVLVLLDNVRSVEQVNPLLPPPPGVAVVTSRDGLAGLDGLAEVCRIGLDGLTESEAMQLLRVLVGARVDQEPQAARAVAARCEYLPLAVRVAAEHTVARPTTSLSALVGELVDDADGLDEFVVPGDERADLRSVFSWSVKRLPEPQRRAFTLLGLAPGFDLDRYGLAALAGIDPATADELAAALLAAHLVESRGVARIAMHDLLRAYAAELAATQMSTLDSQEAVGRLLAFYTHTTSIATDLMFPSLRRARPAATGLPAAVATLPDLSDARVGAAWLAAERINLVRACGHAAGNGRPREAVALALALGRYLEDLHYEDALSVHSAAAGAVVQLGEECEPADRAGVWTGLGLAHWRLGDADLAIRHIESSFEAHHAAGDIAAAARNLAMLGVVLVGQGRHHEAIACHRRGIGLAQDSGLPVTEAIALSNLASVHFEIEECQTAYDLWEQARRIAEDAGESWPLGTIREGLAAALVGLGRYEEALAHAKESVAIYRSFAQVLYRLRADAVLGSALRGLGRHAEAVEHLTGALRECRAHGNPRPTSLVLNSLGQTWNELGDGEQGLACHAEALALAERHSNQREHTHALVGLGDAYATIGDLEQARQWWQQARDVYEAAGLPATERLRARPAGPDGSRAEHPDR
jgi:tetratricopeptide (TPR) repeat protein/transcriptional regulator with XRE-family HTH domain